MRQRSRLFRRMANWAGLLVLGLVLTVAGIAYLTSGGGSILITIVLGMLMFLVPIWAIVWAFCSMIDKSISDPELDDEDLKRLFK